MSQRHQQRYTLGQQSSSNRTTAGMDNFGIEDNGLFDELGDLDSGMGSFHQSMRTPPLPRSVSSPSSHSASQYSDPGHAHYDSNAASFASGGGVRHDPGMIGLGRRQQLNVPQHQQDPLNPRKQMVRDLQKQHQIGSGRGRQDGVDEMFFNYLAFQLDCEDDGALSSSGHKKVHRVPPRVDKSRFPNSLYSHDLVVESLDEVFEIRPMSPDDDLRAQQFCRLQVAEEFKRSALLDKVPPKWSFTHVNYRRNFNMIAVSRRTDAIVGVSQYTRSNDSKATSGSIGGIVDLGVAVLTRYQAHGIGSHLLKSLANAAKHENDLVLRANFIPANTLAQKVFENVLVKQVGAKKEIIESTPELITVLYRLADSSAVVENWEF